MGQHPIEERPIRWGISATGGIAHEFAVALRDAPGAQLAAVSSRSQARGQAFAETFGIPRAHGSITDLAEDENVDVVYVASPAPSHRSDALAVIGSGKAALIEKPLGMNESDVAQIFSSSSHSGTFVMEAMSTRFLPAFVEIRKLIHSGQIGEIRSIEASFGLAASREPRLARLFDPDMGGGGLLDLGVYAGQLIQEYLGLPSRTAASILLGTTGVDVEAAASFDFPGGAMATLRTSLDVLLPNTARIAGTEGAIEIDSFFHTAERYSVQMMVPNSVSQMTSVSHLATISRHRLAYEAIEVMMCLREGRRESPLMSWNASIETMRILDSVRRAGHMRATR